MLHVFALANVLQVDIVSVYPAVDNYLYRPLLHARIQPSRHFTQNRFHLRNNELVIMWSRDETIDNRPGIMFTPNHVVPLMVRQCEKTTFHGPAKKKQKTLFSFFGSPPTKPNRPNTASDEIHYQDSLPRFNN